MDLLGRNAKSVLSETLFSTFLLRTVSSFPAFFCCWASSRA